MPSLSTYIDFLRSTGDARKKKPKQFEDASKRRNYLSRLMLYGSEPERWLVNGGVATSQPIIFKNNGSFRFIQPGQTRTYTDAQILQRADMYMRYSESYWAITNAEYQQNLANSGGTTEFEQWVDITELKRTGAMNSHEDGVEDALWAVPDKTTMEGNIATSTAPYSIWAWINDRTDGLFTLGPGGSWTVKGGLDPADAAVTNGNWEPQLVGYDVGAGPTNTKFLDGIDELIAKVHFAKPDSKEMASTPDIQRTFLVTTPEGLRFMKSINRAGQDVWNHGEWVDSGIKSVSHEGIRVIESQGMRDSAVYDDGAGALVTEATADIKGPRVLAINGHSLHPMMHSDYFFTEEEPIRDAAARDRWIVPYDLWHNIICTNVKEQGMLRPITTDVASVYP